MDAERPWWQSAAFDPAARRWVSRAHPGAVPVLDLDGALVCDESSLRWAAEDFGHVVHHRPRAVRRPGEVADVAAVVAFAGKVRLAVAARGAGYATHGQAQTSGGIVIDMAGLSLVSEVRAGWVTAQGGALWSEVLRATLAHSCTPAVLTDYLDLSVGGTVAVGGVGGTSHRYGLQVDCVQELTVVTGAAALLPCSPKRNQRLFDAVRAGLGQCGIVVSATIAAIPAPARAGRLWAGPALPDPRRPAAGTADASTRLGVDLAVRAAENRQRRRFGEHRCHDRGEPGSARLDPRPRGDRLPDQHRVDVTCGLAKSFRTARRRSPRGEP